MADFSKLREGRKSRQTRSYASGPLETPKNTLDNQQVSSMKAVEGFKAPVALKDGLYSKLPQSLEIREDKETGRGIYSLYPRKPGDILISIKPHVATLSNDHLESCCSSCFRFERVSLRRCTGCKVVHYCDTACQTADWPLHKQECTAIQRWAPQTGTTTIPGDAIRCLGRILWRKQKLGMSHAWSREIDALQSHRTSISKDPNSNDSQLYTQLSHAIIRFLGLNSPEEMKQFGLDTAADLVDVVSRFTTNTFTVSNPSLEPLGACVSPLVALINHSCDPNAVVVFPRAGPPGHENDEPLMQVIAIRPIAPNEQVLTSYIDSTLPRALRRKMLKETYHFTCRCTLCVPVPIAHATSTPVDLREAMWCPKRCGGVCLLPTEEDDLTRCSKCKALVKDTDALLDAVRVGQEGLDKAEALQFTKTQKSIQLTTNLIPILTSAGLVPSAHPLLGLARLNAALLISNLPSILSAPALVPTFSNFGSNNSDNKGKGKQKEEDDAENIEDVKSPLISSTSSITPLEAQEALDEAIRASTRSFTALSSILVEGHPVRGIALAELGKLLSVDEVWAEHVSVDVKSQSGMAKAPPYPPSGPARLKLAYETLLRARRELCIGFGSGQPGRVEGGKVGQEVREMLVRLEKEMAVWKNGVRDAKEDLMLEAFGKGLKS